MFDKRRYLYSPCSGKSNALSTVPDEAFSSGMLGIGYAVTPNSGEIYSPCDGTIGNIAESKHAYTITTRDGVDVLVHIGIDTVNLNGNGFDVKVSKGEKVKHGDLLANVSLETIKNAGYITSTIVLITNPEAICEIEYDIGNDCTKEDALISYRKA